MKNTIIPLFVFISLTLFTGTNTVLALSSLPFGIQESIIFEMLPTAPEPNQDVAVKITAYGVDLSRSNIQWYEDGKKIKEGVGERETTITTKGAGKTSTIRVVVSKQSGGVIEKSLVIVPNEVNLTIEADTIVPPFYKGKSLGSHQSTYRFIAIPNMFDLRGQQISSDTIYYKWTINGKVDLDNSGINKPSYTYVGKVVSRPVEIFIETSTLDGKFVAKKRETIEPILPKVLFFEKDPVLGLLTNRSFVGQYQLTKQEIELVAFPLFFDKKSLEYLEYSWASNGKKVGAAIGQSLSFRRVDGEAGLVNISATIVNPDSLLQESSAQLRIDYEENFNFSSQ